jgi:hypothetical protein
MEGLTMETLIAAMITGLFSYWIWMLKAEMNDLQKHLTAAPAGAAHHRPTSQNPLKPNWEGNVPTWNLQD